MRIFGTALIAALLLAIEPRSSAPIDGETEVGLTIGWQQGLAGSDAPGVVVFSGWRQARPGRSEGRAAARRSPYSLGISNRGTACSARQPGTPPRPERRRAA